MECQDELNGRADKKFCSGHCRSSYNNRLNADQINLRRRVNRILGKNRNILARLNPGGKKTVHKTSLLEEGFNFNYFTNRYVTRKGRVYFFCYDQGYWVHDASYLTLVERKDYID
jgi:hypothetical protein